ncbi:anaerobic ribonucleoside-triphosphate reductase activating protein [Thiocystis minor]|uniref:anaerobic ribonucleoside-triphosphate reductase activating protein n=1 Tax=Thiocystis minor TaxID=61597 RepID=UPI001911A61E|nr:anaerobic ribonucleoside-triphosphate reductase activating protein [Thiocystis minor]MBK5964079.1 anaerobic ribonucleoside-triphosphate reductase activating protein [Thiocystis minor]
MNAAPTVDAESLRIGGLTRLTTIDYPGELAAVIFCQGCPWRCRYCHNRDLLDPDANTVIDWREVIQFLTQRRGLLDAVVFSGGEPTAQQALSSAMSEARGLGFKIGLHTSGAYPERLRRLLPLLDWVGLDIKALPEDYDRITGVEGSGKPAWESLSRLLESGIALEVRTTVMPDWTPPEVAAIAHALADVGVKNYALQGCDTQHALDRNLPNLRFPLRELAGDIESGRFARFTLREA